LAAIERLAFRGSNPRAKVPAARPFTAKTRTRRWGAAAGRWPACRFGRAA